MSWKFAFLATAFIVPAMTPVTAAAQDRSPEIEALDAQLPGTIINDPTSLKWDMQGADFKQKPVQDPAIPGGGAATRYTIEKAGPNPWSVAAAVPLTGSIARGDQVTVGFWARSGTAETASLNIRVQQTVEPYGGVADKTVSLTPEWQWYEASGTSTVDISRSAGAASFQLATAKQVVEIGQTIVVKGALAIQPQQVAVAAAPEPLPPQIDGKGTLLNAPEFRGWGFSGPESTRAMRDDKTIYLGKATQVIANKGANPWDISANIPIRDAIAEGDTLLIAIAAKTVSATTADGKANVIVRIQDNSTATYDGFINAAISPGPNWQLLQMRVTAPFAIAAGNGALALQFAGADQTVDVGPVYVMKAN